MKRISIILLTFVLSCTLNLSSRAQEGTPFHIWNHKLAVPLEAIKRFGVMQNSLLIRYADNSTLAISLDTTDSLPAQPDKTANEILAAVYGEQEPTDEALKIARAITLKEALEHKVYTSGPLSVYFFRYPNQEIAYVADPDDGQRYLIVEGKGKSLKRILDSLTRR